MSSSSGLVASGGLRAQSSSGNPSLAGRACCSEAAGKSTLYTGAACAITRLDVCYEGPCPSPGVECDDENSSAWCASALQNESSEEEGEEHQRQSAELKYEENVDCQRREQYDALLSSTNHDIRKPETIVSWWSKLQELCGTKANFTAPFLPQKFIPKLLRMREDENLLMVEFDRLSDENGNSCPRRITWMRNRL